MKNILSKLALVALLVSIPVFAARTDSPWLERVGSYLTTSWPEGRDILINGVNKYLNFGTFSGSSGYGFRDNGGTIEFKNSGGAWAGIGSGSGGGTLADISAGSTNATDSLYTMTNNVNVVFETAGGTDFVTINEANEQVNLNNGTAALPSLTFGATDNGIYGSGGTSLRFSMGGTFRWGITGTEFQSATTGGAYLLRSAASATVPAHAFVGDENTGIGSSGSDVLSLIAGGTQTAQVSSTALVLVGSSNIGSLTTPVFQFGGTTNGLYLDTNRIFIKANNTFVGGFATTGWITPNGTATNPSVNTNGDGNTGLYMDGSDGLGLSTGGTASLTINSSGAVAIPSNSLSVKFDSGINLDGGVLSIVRQATGSFASGSTVKFLGASNINKTFSFATSTQTQTSGSNGIVEIFGTFGAGAGSGTYRPLEIQYTINNSGAQSGTATGIFLNATETALNSMTHKLMDLQIGGASQFTVSRTGLATASAYQSNSYVQAGGTDYLSWSSRAKMHSPADGIIRLTDSASTDFNRLQFGGTTSSFPALKRSSTGIEVRLADDSGYAPLTSSTLLTSSTVQANGGYILSASSTSYSSSGTDTFTSSTSSVFNNNRGFAPTSGTGVFNGYIFGGTINQTGGANGITRGLYINPTLTAAADWKAIETTGGQLKMSDTYAAGSGSLAGSLLDLAQTWNTSGTPTAIKLNVTDTASNASSLLMDIQKGGVSQFKVSKGGAITSASHVVSGGDVQATTSGSFKWNTRSDIKSPSDGVITLMNAANTDFSRLQFGGTTSSFPALKRSSATLQARLANDSGYAEIYAAAGTSANAVATIDGTQTLTNKRITARVNTTADTGSLTINSDTTDQYTVTALAQSMTINAPTGTPTNGQKLLIRIKDDGTARALTWNATFKPIGVTLPTTTVISKLLYVGAIYNATASQWDVLAVGQES